MIPQTFGEMCSQVQNFIQDDSNTTREIVKTEINNAYVRHSRQHDWPELIVELNEGITSTASTSYLALPGDCSQIIQIADKVNDRVFSSKTLSANRADGISNIDTNTAVYYYSELGYLPIRRPLSVDDTVEITVPNTALTIEVDVKITGLRASPEIVDDDTIKTSTTTVVGGAITFREGWSIHSIATNGTHDNDYIEIRETTSNNVLAHIPKRRKQSQYYVIQFQGRPSTSNSLNVIYKKGVNRLEDADDVLMIPDLAEAIVEEAIANMRQYDKKYQQAGAHIRDANDHRDAVLSERRLQGAHHRQMRPDFRGRGLFRGY